MKTISAAISAAVVIATTTPRTATAFTTPLQKTLHQTKPALLPSLAKGNALYSEHGRLNRCLSPNKVQKALKSTNNENADEEGFFNGVEINLRYALPFVGFVSYAIYSSNTVPAETTDTIINAFIADPQNGISQINEFFSVIFNLLGFFAAPLACVTMPAAKDQKLPLTPFLIGSMFGGYGIFGIAASTWRSMTAQSDDDAVMTKSDLGWFTANVLENKIFNVAILALALSVPISTGALDALLTHPGQTFQGYVDLFQSTTLVAASTLDFTILTAVGASFIPDDLKRRGVTDSGKANLIALSTLLLPFYGLCAYCVLRPSMAEE